jgi:hypothetical protein
MLDRFRRAMNYWMFAVSRPGYVLDIAQRDRHRVRISFYIVLVFSALYTFTAWNLWRNGRLPIMEPWIGFIQPADYYLYQALWTLPWMVSVWLIGAGVIYLFTTLAGKEGYFEDSLMISALSVSIPYLMFWFIPETFIFPALGPGTILKWPELFELERRFAFPGIWQVVLTAYGMRKLNTTNRLVCLAAGALALGFFYMILLPFMR